MKTFLEARWENIVMVNYEVDANILLPYLPYGVELDTFDDKCFVSLVGFKFAKSKIFGINIPFYGTFDEVNLRFYVKRTDGAVTKRGVVFVSEVVPYKIVSLLANKLYKEHYSFAKMSSSLRFENDSTTLEYNWKPKAENFSIKVCCVNEKSEIPENSLEEFIYEHYYGFTKVSAEETWEYKVNHPRWETNQVKDCTIHCDFEDMYGKHFAFLNDQKPFSVYNAIGSKVAIDWKINKLRK